jgi:hypothetical protein
LILEEKFNRANNVVKAIHEMVKTSQVSYMDAILHYAEETGMDIDAVAEIVSKNDLIKSKLEVEAESLHFLKKKSRLPIP